ncbi:RNA-directed DNA polymerase, eukaryota [Tanacetum coccineum]
MGTRRFKEDDWTEVTRKNRGYRTKEDDLVKVHSNADLTRTISKSIFVTNFPDNTTSADLWNICQTYGVVVDVYIPNRRSKVGKRFAFVRFIKVTNVERLVGNLCTLWIGRMHLHANVVRFERTPFQQSQPPPPTRPGKIAPSFVSAVKGILPTPVLSPPAMVLDDSCMVTTDLRNYVMGEVKLFSSVNNLRVILSAEGFSIQKVVYLGGLWVMFELPSANSKSKFLAHVGVGSWFKSLSNPQPDFSPRDRIIWVDVEGVPMHAWSSNTFHKIGSMWGEVLELGDCKDECFAREVICVRAKELFVWSPSFVEVTEADDIHEEGEFIQIGEEGLEKPIHQNDVVGRECIEASANNVDDQFSGEYRKTYRKRKKVVLSWRILERDDIGRSNHGFLDGRRTKGYEKSRGHGDQSPTPPLWSAMYLGRFYMKSGGKEERWGSIFNVYGARDFNHFITSVGLVEVQLEGYSYTWAHPSASKMSKLDRFLVSDGFLSLFPHTSAVCLDRHLSDHRPILLREFNTDYGATPFRLFHSWFDFQGFDDMITQTWNLLSQDSNAMGSLQKNSGSQKSDSIVIGNLNGIR